MTGEGLCGELVQEESRALWSSLGSVAEGPGEELDSKQVKSTYENGSRSFHFVVFLPGMYVI